MYRFVIATLVAASLLPFTAQSDQPDPIAAEESLTRFKLADPTLRIELVAAEPEVFDPVALAFDARGRMFVVENRGYPTNAEGRVGTVAMLEDKDGDGRYETRTVFADGFDFPNGVMPWKNGILVTCAPDLLYLEDSDGDGRADVRDVLLTGFALGGSTQLRVSHPTLGVDNWIYLTNGLSGGDITSPRHPEQPVLKMGSLDLRYHPLTGVYETTAGQAQFGLAFDDFGHKFVCSNRKHIEQIILQPGDLARNPHLTLSQTVAAIPEHGEAARIYAVSEATTTAFAHAGTFTAACGLTIYRGDALPPAYRGNAFVCDPTGNLIHRDVLEPNGAALIAKRGEENTEFLATTDNWCRPVFLTNGPDGALYLCDMYRKTIEHPTYLPKEVAAITDFDAGKDRGRIYRITSANIDKRERLQFESATTDSLVEALSSSNGWTRDTAHRLLLERTDPDAEASLRALLEQEALPDAAYIHALSLLDGIGKLAEADLLSAIDDLPARARTHAVRLARSHLGEMPDVAGRLVRLGGDPNPEVRFQCALALGDCDPAGAVDALASMALQGLDDAWAQSAVLSSLSTERIVPFATAVVNHAPEQADGLPSLLEQLGQLVASSQPPEETAKFASLALRDAGGRPDLGRLAVAKGLAVGIHRGRQFPAGPNALARLANAGHDLTDVVARLISSCTSIASDESAPIDLRCACVDVLAFASFDDAGPALQTLLSPQYPQELELAAVRALTTMNDARVAEALVAPDAWNAFTAPIRTAALTGLMSTAERVSRLVEALERGDVPPFTVDASRRAQLLNHGDPAIQSRAKEIFKDVRTTNREQVYEEYKFCLELQPDPASGREVFANLCSSCHRFDGIGYEVGPDLTGIRSQPLESILMHILMPNWLMEEGYENYTIETTSLESFSGIIKAQNESSVTIRGALGVEATIPRGDIESMRTESMSLMPEELEKGMTAQQLRDLLGYLKGETP